MIETFDVVERNGVKYLKRILTTTIIEETFFSYEDLLMEKNRQQALSIETNRLIDEAKTRGLEDGQAAIRLNLVAGLPVAK